MESTRAEVLAHRAAVQDLHGGAEIAALGVLSLGFVDSPPKTGGAGLAVRVGPEFLWADTGGGRVGEPGGREFGGPGSGGPESGGPGLGRPGSGRPGPDGPGSGRWRSGGSGSDRPESGRRGRGGPESGRSGSYGPGSGRLGFGGSEADGPGSGGPGLGRSGFGGAGLGGAESDGLGSDGVGSDWSGAGESGAGVPALGGSSSGESNSDLPGLGRSGGEPGGFRAGVDRSALGTGRFGRQRRWLAGREAGESEFFGPEVDRLVRVLSLRGAPHLHRAADLPVVRRELRPRTPRQWAAWTGGFDVPGPDGLDVLVELLHREFPGERATKGELSALVSPRLSADWTPWCRPCGVRHVLDGLFRLGTLLAGIELEHVGARLVFRKPTGPVPVVEPEGEPTLLSAYARLVGPFAKADAVKWLGAGPPSTWPDGLRPVVVEGRRLLALEDVRDAPPPPAGVLLFPRDPYLLGPRWLVAPDAAVAERVWRAVGSPGALVVHGEVVGEWRYAFSGRTMTFHVRGWKKVKGEVRESIAGQAELLAAVWGGSALEPNVVEWDSP